MSDGCSDSDDEDLAFSNLDMTEVDFDNSDDHNEEHAIDEQDEKLILFEKEVLFDTAHQISASKAPSFVLSKCDSNESETSELMKMSRDFNAGKYVNVLRSKTAFHVFAGTELSTQQESLESEIDLLALLASNARQRIISYCSSLERCIEVEIIAVSALSLFLQLNYTGPSLENNLDSTAEIVTKESILEGIHPHPLFKTCLHYSEPSDNSYEEPSSNDFDQKTKKSWNIYHNRILSYLSVDGEWPCQVCENPYFLFISRIILNTLANPNRKDWTHSVDFSDVKSSPIPNENKQKQSDDILNKNDSLYKKKQDLSSQTSYETTPTEIFLEKIAKLRLVHLWNSRAIVAHQRLLQCDEPSLTLWMECKDSFERCKQLFCYDVNEENRTNAVTLSTEKSNITEDENEVDNYHNHQGVAARVMLEWGLAEHHFDRDGKGKLSFQSACEYSGVQVNVMGAYGKRTKFQIDAKAQMLVQAFSTAPILKEDKISQNDESKNFDETGSKKIKIKEKEVQHDGEEILLDRVKFENEEFNVSEGNLNVLDQAILLALCLDVKNDNPMDGLTGEQMGGYLERVLIEHDDWMVYSTGLLERAWLECERVHSRERAILQIQALVDQHTNRLTITQSTFKSVEDSAPVQDRLRNVHFLVYPPRWEVMRDLAERYAKLGIVTTAAEIFEEIELWDEVVECYTHAGKASKAEEVVRRRLQIAETPRMWVALGGLTNDPQYYEKAIEISKGKFAVAYIELGQYYLKQGDVHKASDLFKKGLDVKPLTPHVWFLLGTVCMQISDWEVALQAFSEVVQQEPEEGDAWANIAAIHMHNKDPTKAYPAIIESLKQNRKNWRVWINKLYTCIDLGKLDEAIQACKQLMQFRGRKNATENIPPIEEKCIRAIVGKAVTKYENAVMNIDEAALDSAKRTIERVDELLTEISRTTESKSWVWEIRAIFDGITQNSANVLDLSMKEYRSILSTSGWETDLNYLSKMSVLIFKISDILKSEGGKPNLLKCKMIVNGVAKKIRRAYFDKSDMPQIVDELEQLQRHIEDDIKVLG